MNEQCISVDLTTNMEMHKTSRSLQRNCYWLRKD